MVGTTPGTRVPVEIVRASRRLTLEVTVQELQLSGGIAPRQGEQQPGETIGLSLSRVTPSLARQLGLPQGTTGVVVTGVEPRSAAASGGVQPGDLILEINRQPVPTVDEVAGALRGAPGGTVFLLVQRRGQQVFLTVTR